MRFIDVEDGIEEDVRPGAPPIGKDEPPRATLYVAPDPAHIPPRGWLHGGHYMRQIVSATVSPGGFGKTTLALYEALNMVAAGLHVWYVSGEDAKEELDRRIAAHCQLHLINVADLSGRLFVDDRTTFPFSIASAPRPGQIKFNESGLAKFEAAIRADAIDVVILDPWVSFHTVHENDNGAIDALVKRLGVVALKTNCGIETSHHVRKPMTGQTAITVDDARGASALINACRSARVINRMSSADAAAAKVDNDKRNAYIRLDNGKTNMRPATAAAWFQLVDVELINTDHVQALAPWKFPDLFAGVTLADTDWVRELVRQKPYRASSQTDDLGLNVHEKADCARINKMIGVWLSNKVFAKEPRQDPDSRKPRPYYVPIKSHPDDDNVIPFPTQIDDE